jgi:hypothetical protein
MPELLIELNKQYPAGIPILVVVFLMFMCWHLAITWKTYTFMRDNMVTKQQMKEFKLKLTLEFDDRYVRIDTPPRGHTRAAQAGG